MLIYGKNSCLEYLKKNKKVKSLYLDRSFSDKRLISLIENLQIKPYFYTKFQLDQLAEENHQGIILNVKGVPSIIKRILSLKPGDLKKIFQRASCQHCEISSKTRFTELFPQKRH